MMPPAKKDARPKRARTPAFVKALRGVKNWKEASDWLEWRGIEDIECITPDQAGVVGTAVVNLISSMAKLELTSARGAVAIRRL